MKTINVFLFFLLAILLSACNDSKEKKNNNSIMDYKLSWDGTSNLLGVNLSYTRQSKDSSSFIYGSPDFGGQEDIFGVLKNITVGVGDSLELYPEERKLVIRHHGENKNNILNYSIDGTLVYGKDKAQPIWEVASERFRPNIVPNHLYVYGESYLMQYESDQEIQHLIHWENYPKNMTSFDSYDLDQDPSTISETTYSELANSISIISDDIDINIKVIKDIPHYFVTSKQNKTISEAFNDKTFQYFSEIMDFWEDYDHDYYWAAILPVHGKVMEGHSGSGGYALNDGFYMNYAGDLDPRTAVFTICHEAVHRWIGSEVNIGNSSFDHQWLGEGFTEYITMYTAINSGLMNLDEFYEEINDAKLLAHYTSDVKEVHNDSIAEMFWTNGEIQSLPYKRGFIFAFYLDNQIRLASNNTKTIRDFLLDLKVKASTKENSLIEDEGPLTLEEFIQVGGQYLDKEKLKMDVEKYVINGKLIDFNQVELLDAFQLKYDSPYADDECSTIKEAFGREGFVNAIGKEGAAKQEKVFNVFKKLLLTKDITSFVKNTADGFTFLDNPLESLQMEVNKIHATSICIKTISGNSEGWKVAFNCNKSDKSSQGMVLLLDNDYRYVKVSNVEEAPSIKLKAGIKLKDIYSW